MGNGTDVATVVVVVVVAVVLRSGSMIRQVQEPHLLALLLQFLFSLPVATLAITNCNQLAPVPAAVVVFFSLPLGRVPRFVSGCLEHWRGHGGLLGQ